MPIRAFTTGGETSKVSFPRGAVLAAEVAVRMKKDSIPLPAAPGFFSGYADWAKGGDSAAFFGVPGLADAAVPSRPYESPDLRPYIKGHNPADPLLSPLLADLRGLPPTLNITGTRDLLLSDTARFHRALLKAGVRSELIVYEAMPHAFWYQIGTPESQEALGAMAEFFKRQLDARAKT